MAATGNKINIKNLESDERSVQIVHGTDKVIISYTGICVVCNGRIYVGEDRAFCRKNVLGVTKNCGFL